MAMPVHYVDAMGGGVDCARISRILLCTFQAIFSVKLQVILKMACGEAKIQKFSMIFCVLTIYIVEMYKKVCKVIRRKSEIRAHSRVRSVPFENRNGTRHGFSTICV